MSSLTLSAPHVPLDGQLKYSKRYATVFLSKYIRAAEEKNLNQSVEPLIEIIFF